jgi:hypothetical protein
MGQWPAAAVLGDSTPTETPGLRDRSAWWVAVLYGVLTLLLAYPLWLHPGSHLMSPSADTELTMWALAWDTHAFTHQPLAIFDANIYYPQHLTLAYSENFIGSALLAAPVLWLTGNPVLAFNLIALASSVFCGLGAFLLARSLRVSVAGATLAGIVFAFSPPRFLRIDQLHLAPIQWIPFCLAYLVRYLDDGRPRNLRIAVAFFSLQALTSGHGAVFLVVAIILLAVLRLLRGMPIAIVRRVRDFGLGGAAALAPTVLMFVPYLIVQRETGLRRALLGWSIRWSSFLASPSHVDAWVLSLFPAAQINETAGAYLFPGILPILLACAAIGWRRTSVRAAAAGVTNPDGGRSLVFTRPPDTIYAALLTGIAVWLSVGSPVGIWPLVYWLPGFNLIRVPSRFMLLAVLGLAMLAGIGFDRIAAWLVRRRSRHAEERRGHAFAVPALAAVLGALLVAEFAAMPFGTTPYTVDPPAIDRWLATRPGSFTIAEVPLPNPADFGAWERREAQFMLHSTAHWQKTVHGYSGFRTPLHEELFARLATFPSEASIRSLTDLSVTYVVVHTDLYWPEEWKQIERAIEKVPALKLEHVEGAGRVYSLPR